MAKIPRLNDGDLAFPLESGQRYLMRGESWPISVRRPHAEPLVSAVAAYLITFMLIAPVPAIASAAVPFVIDASRLVEVQSVEQLPLDLKKILGRQKNGIEGLADRRDEFNRTDVIDTKLPMRRFAIGGAGPGSALVAYEQGGRGYSIHAVAFALGTLGWVEVGEWTLQKTPDTLRGLLGLINGKHYTNQIRSRPLRRDGPLRELNVSDEEVREIKAATLEIFPGSILNISGVVKGCPCEEGVGCSDQVWVVTHQPGHTQGLELSRIDGHWGVGVVQQWWLSFEQLQTMRSSAGYIQALQGLNDSFPTCTNKPAVSIQEAAQQTH